ncbi:hypothetical protein BDW60DRAFT_33103 [Aspergillus nidulans var. acristatus]
MSLGQWTWVADPGRGEEGGFHVHIPRFYSTKTRFLFLVDRLWLKSCGSAPATALRSTTDFKVAEGSFTGYRSKELTTWKFRTGSAALSPLLNSPLRGARESEEVQDTSGTRRSFDAYNLYCLVSLKNHTVHPV